jgi:hypothetical protein
MLLVSENFEVYVSLLSGYQFCFHTMTVNLPLQLTKHQISLQGGRKAVAVNAPTRWASHFLVMQSVKDSKISFLSAVASAAWTCLGGKAEEVRDTVMEGTFWEEMDMLLELLKPFSQAIHQLEGDRPHLSECHVTLLALEKHVMSWADKYKDVFVQVDKKKLKVADNALNTFLLRHGNKPGGKSAPVCNAAYSAAFAVDPYYAECDKSSGTQHFCAQA